MYNRNIETRSHSCKPQLLVCSGQRRFRRERQGPLHESLRLNIGGTSYQLSISNIMNAAEFGVLYEFANSSHEQRLEQCDEYIEDSEEYFFERTAALFEPVYHYYITGFCYKPCYVPEDIFQQELLIWGLLKVFYPNLVIFERTVDVDVDTFKDIVFGETRRKIWNLVETPESSWAAKVFAGVSIIAILISNLGLVLGSMPEFQIRRNTTDNSITSVENELHPSLEYMEIGFIIIFTLEYLTRLIVTPTRKAFFFKFLNLMDLIAILPFYIESAFQLLQLQSTQLRVLLVLRVLRVVRVFRLFTLARYSMGLKMFVKVMRLSLHQLGMVLAVIGIAVMFFSTFIYFAEKNHEGTKFNSIPAAFWWCIVTATTVGYGDMYPETTGGKLIASLAIISSVLLLCLPVTVIAESFMKVQKEFMPKGRDTRSSD